MYMIRQILATQNSDRDVKYMLDNYEWVILPVLNVDGYEYTHTRVCYLRTINVVLYSFTGTQAQNREKFSKSICLLHNNYIKINSTIEE